MTDAFMTLFEKQFRVIGEIEPSLLQKIHPKQSLRFIKAVFDGE